MFIDHVAVYVNDLESAKDFFVKYFAAVPGEIYRNEKNGFSSYFLSFENGAKLEIMNRPEIEKTEKPFYKSVAINVFSYFYQIKIIFIKLII